MPGPIVGILVFFLLQNMLADYGSGYLMSLGPIGIVGPAHDGRDGRGVDRAVGQCTDQPPSPLAVRPVEAALTAPDGDRAGVGLRSPGPMTACCSMMYFQVRAIFPRCTPVTCRIASCRSMSIQHRIAGLPPTIPCITLSSARTTRISTLVVGVKPTFHQWRCRHSRHREPRFPCKCA